MAIFAMRRSFFVILLLSCSYLVSAQNLVPCSYFCYEGDSPDTAGAQISCPVGPSPIPGIEISCICDNAGGFISCLKCGVTQTQISYSQLCHSAPNTCAFDWAPLVQGACSNYHMAQKVAPATLGYFGQILNIVCAAAKSMDPCCQDMIPNYNLPGCTAPWACQFTQYVFNSFLGGNSKFDTPLEIENEILAIGSQIYQPWYLRIPGIGQNEVGSLLAGAEHFESNLLPAFRNYIDMMVQRDVPTCNALDLSNQIATLQSEHQSFFQCAVKPGFGVEGMRGELSPIAVAIAQAMVPWAASTLRNYLVNQALNEFYYPKCPDVLADSPAKRNSQRCGLINNASTPTLGHIRSEAAFLNLTAPDDAPLAYDPRAWVPAVEQPASVSALPSLYFHILPNTSSVAIERKFLDSTASVNISANRSTFHSEAAAAVSLNSVGWNASNTSVSTTAYPVPNTTLSVFGLISMIFHATAPIGNNSYLFDSNGTNATYAQYLNKSSVFDNGYNVLFSAFDLFISYDALPAGVMSTDVVLIDLVAGSAVKSSKVDSSDKSVSAVGLKGHPGVWGGGGIYALGFEGATSNMSAVSLTSYVVSQGSAARPTAAMSITPSVSATPVTNFSATETSSGSISPVIENYLRLYIEILA